MFPEEFELWGKIKKIEPEKERRKEMRAFKESPSQHMFTFTQKNPLEQPLIRQKNFTGNIGEFKDLLFLAKTGSF